MFIKSLCCFLGLLLFSFLPSEYSRAGGDDLPTNVRLGMPPTFATTNKLKIEDAFKQALGKLPQVVSEGLPHDLTITCRGSSARGDEAWPWLAALHLHKSGIVEASAEFCKNPPAAALLVMSFVSAISRYYARHLDHQAKKAFGPYLNLIGLEKEGLLIGRRAQRNKVGPKNTRMPDLENLPEALAFDLPLYLMDGRFACARPASAEIFAQLFGASPTIASCTLFNAVPLVGYTQLLHRETIYQRLEPQELLDVAYVHVQGGKRLSQGFGHALLKITICPPHEEPDWCRAQLDHQLAISYRGIEEPPLAGGKDHHGQAMMRGLLMPWREILLEYSTKDARPLHAYELSLQPEEKAMLVRAFLERSELAARHYHLLQHNCASALLGLLNIVLSAERQIFLSLATPGNLAATLQAHGLAGPQPNVVGTSEDEWAVYHHRLMKLMSPAAADALAGLARMPAKERLQMWQHLFGDESLRDHTSTREEALTISMNLENLRIRYKEAEAVKKLKRVLGQASPSKSAPPQDLEECYRRAMGTLQAAVEVRWRESPCSGSLYGLPTYEEVIEAEPLHEAAISQAIEAVDHCQALLLAEETSDVTIMKEAIAYLFKQL